MRIAQLLLDEQSIFAKKVRRLDAAALTAAGVEIVDLADRADVVHVYGTRTTRKTLRDVESPIVSEQQLPFPAKGFFYKPPVIRQVISGEIDEPVDAAYFETVTDLARKHDGIYLVGSYEGPRKVRNAIDQARIRLSRFRTDIEWITFAEPPTLAQLQGLDGWIDPASDENDFDGLTAEAVVAGMKVVATRTLINPRRLAGGAAGLLVPRNDPNELVHALLNSLFKDEVIAPRLARARETRSRFDATERARNLIEIYQRVAR